MAARKDTLKAYRQKRDFTLTQEPEGILGKAEGRRYLIQKHEATRLHYDFRLELDGVLKSWAVTRGPSLDPHEKRLAVEVEDHPVNYGHFEGTIPKGQYGGGTVMLWDEGEWEPIGDPRAGLAKGKLEFVLKGKRLKGEWTLVRMKRRGKEKDNGRNNWLLIKHQDKVAREGDGEGLTKRYTTSVASKRSMENIAAAKDAVWQSAGKSEKPKPGVKKKARAEKVKPLPGFMSPQLATLVDALPEGEAWLHEIKFDGYRMQAQVQDGHVQMLTRNGKDWTVQFQQVADALASLPVESAILDGEAVVLDEKGASSFLMLRNALSNQGSNKPLHYYVFDLLYLNGKDLRRLPLVERKALLEALLKKHKNDRVIFSEHFTSPDRSIMSKVCGMGLEGLISKRADSAYLGGREKTWLKTKCHKRQEFVIGGFTFPTHKERGLGALLLGYYQNAGFHYAGKVGTGFDHDTSYALRGMLDGLKIEHSAFESVPADGRRGAQWVRPTLVCEVEFTEWTDDGRLRHPSFHGLREDKPAKAVERDNAMPVRKATGESLFKKEKHVAKPTIKEGPSPAAGKGKIDVGGIGISHPERVIYEDAQLTKLDLAQYYLAMADHILTHVAARPLSLLRCPEGSGEPCFFQRHIAQGQSEHLLEAAVAVKGKKESYLMIEDAMGLITLVQWGVIEMHPWGCRADKPELPDRIIFDLDPDPGVEWKDMIAAAKDVRARMAEFGLESFLKTTGGKGLHVTVPLTRKYGWDTIKSFAHAVALSMAHDQPERYIAKSSKAARKGKIFVDYLRNDLTSTSVAPFSARAREGATVAMPIAWDALTLQLTPAKFTISTVPALLAKRKQDPWRDFFKTRQTIAAKILKALAIVSE